MGVSGTNVTLHTASSTTWHAGRLEHHRWTMAYTHWALLLFYFSFSTCALSSASSSWSDCQHQERAGNKVLPCKRLRGRRTTEEPPSTLTWLKGGTSLLLLTRMPFLLCKPQHSHTQMTKFKKKRGVRDSCSVGFCHFTLQTSKCNECTPMLGR